MPTAVIKLSNHKKHTTFPEKDIYSFIGILFLYLLFTMFYGHKYYEEYIARNKFYCYS